MSFIEKRKLLKYIDIHAARIYRQAAPVHPTDPPKREVAISIFWPDLLDCTEHLNCTWKKRSLGIVHMQKLFREMFPADW